jgi:hypothetical protein
VTSARPWALPPHILHQSVENGLTQLNETQPTPPLLTYQPWTLLTSCLQSPSSSWFIRLVSWFWSHGSSYKPEKYST